ncbi:hypothetical protein HID58_079317 [Brassica napus]|uniref:Uncharacterized protein n=1 Tax=Brassica napus TaxID=3708 RepID=A0ABQ7Y4E7_BRANA|nr:hypothetical protein HID58_079317 [Brassica napus]
MSNVVCLNSYISCHELIIVAPTTVMVTKEGMKDMMKSRPSCHKTAVKGDHIIKLMKQRLLPKQLNFISRANHCMEEEGKDMMKLRPAWPKTVIEEEDVKDMMKSRSAWPTTVVKGDHIFELMKQRLMKQRLLPKLV